MVIFKKIADLKSYLFNQRKTRKIGFVPTMGALHTGHLYLVEESLKNNLLTVVSVFVNPTQFNDIEDFNKYPNTLATDIKKLTSVNCDVLFCPSVNEMYPDGFDEKALFSIGNIDKVLEGAFRPGHFNGVCQIVDKLLKIVEPEQLFMGQKDYQQCMVVQAMIDNYYQNNPLELNVVPTIRSTEGLALSSRNERLTVTAKQNALAIYNRLIWIRDNINNLHVDDLINGAKDYLLQNGFSKIDYVAIADAKTLQPVNTYDANIKTVVLIAAFIDGVRLIDNLIIN